MSDLEELKKENEELREMITEIKGFLVHIGENVFAAKDLILEIDDFFEEKEELHNEA